MRSIELLDGSLLKDKRSLKKLDFWFKLMNKPNGWHYDLDHLWILKKLKNYNIKPGSTILDAGAGQGILQYILCSMGYNVISLDFSPRSIPNKTKGIFKIFGQGKKNIKYSHDYMKVISYGNKSDGGTILKNGFFEKLKKFKTKNLPEYIRRTLNLVRSDALYFYHRIFMSNAHFGTIKHLRAAFHDIPIGSNKIDAIVSVSAIEHSDINLFENSLSELLRVLIPGGPLLITTSATKKKENIMHAKSSGWCFSLGFLKKYISPQTIYFDVSKTENTLFNSKIFYKRLDPYYYKDPEAFCYQKKIKKFPYLPVGINIIK